MLKHKNHSFLAVQLKFLLVLTMLCSETGYSQNFSAGLRAGFTASQINGDKMAGFNKLGGMVGLQVLYRLNKRWDAGFDMLFFQKGSRYDSATFFTGLWRRLELDYVDVPFYIQYKALKPKKVALQAGLGFGVLFHQVYESNPMGGSPPDNFLRPYDFFWLLGAEYRFADKWSFFARYENSILSIGKNNLLINTIRFEAGFYNLAASFGIRYSFSREGER